ncbi:MAG: acyl-ACP--UDP-N-acetylglucosamine O-acyltransferase [Hormoscilla sp. SP12CHS1]|nr:acyl-ACP--UDP-N-acetylglucosamine O-acyltransferase [Hormoscilla sp. SP12CHS1]
MSTLIHPTAAIHPGAKLQANVQIGPYAMIGEHAVIGAGTTIGAHVTIDGWTEIGEDNKIFPGAAIGLEPQDLKYDGSLSLVKIGDRNRIREYVTINRATRAGEMTLIGNGNLLMAYVHVAHNCVIADEVVIANSVALAGQVTIESRAVIGGMLGIHQFVHIGRMAMVGGMSRLDRDVPPYMLVEGNPSRVRSLNLVGLKRACVTAEELGLLKKAWRILYHSGLTFRQALEQLELLPDSEQLQHLHQFMRSSITEGRRGPIPGKR